MTLQKPLTQKLVLLMSITTGVVIANIYYNQPLLVLMAKTYNISELAISNVPMFSQMGYALGLFLIVPLGDKLKRKKLILTDFFFIIASLLFAAFAQSPMQLKIASFFIGLTSVVPQIIVPMAAQLASHEKRGAVIGAVMSGLLIGILGSRTFSGILGAYMGWRCVFVIAAAAMVILFFLLNKFLPEIHPDFHGNYFSLLKSIIHQFSSQPKLRLASIRGALNFASFSIFWTTLVFLLEKPPFFLGSSAAGTMGLVGIAGAVSASVVGKLSDKFNKGTIIVISILLIAASWIVMGFSSTNLIGIIGGAFFLDLGVQSVHIVNQTIIFEGNPAARNRINTVYMVIYFIGGALGTFIAGYIWHYFKWKGISVAGFAIGLLTLTTHLAGTKIINQKNNHHHNQPPK